MIGCRTENIIGFKVKSKTCSKCSIANTYNAQPEEHECTINWEGASGGMEAWVALELCVDLYGSEYNIYVEYIVSDDDSTMRSHLQHDGKGKPPPHVPIPTFKADPSHRIKVMAGPIFKMVKGTKNPRECKKIDALRLKKYIGCYIYQNRNSPIEDMIKRANAPVEHLFNCHEWCDEEWCWAKQLDSKQHEIATRIMEKNRDNVSEASYSGDSDWESVSESSETQPIEEMVAGDDDDDNESDWSTVCEDESDIELEDLGLDEEEVKECAYFLKYEETADVDETIFTQDDLAEMKNRERVMMERNDRGYYRCKIKDKKLYDEIISEYSRFITPAMLEMVHHMWSTQKNEAMNTSVASLAPKHKHYSMTTSLQTRVRIAAACQIVGFASF